MTTTTSSTRLWSNRRYALWLTSDTAKGLGTALFSFAIPLVALFITNDPAQAGIIGGTGMTVRLIVTLFGGVLADRHHRIIMMLVGAGVGAALSGAFMLLALTDALTFGGLLLVEVLMAARAGSFEPASESALKEIVPDEVMGRAQAANQGRDAALQLAGGPLGGLLLAAGAWLIGLVMTVAYGISALTAWLLLRAMRRGAVHGAGSRVAQPAEPGVARDAQAEARADATGNAAADPAGGHAGERGAVTASAASDIATRSDVSDPSDAATPARGMLREIREGFAWLFSRPDLSGVLVIATIINLGFNAAITTVIYALQQAGHSELTIGWMSAAIGGFMLVGAIISPTLVPRISAGTLTIMSLLCSTVGTIVMTVVHEPWAIVLVFGGAVFMLPSLNAALMGYFMVATPTRLLGRANSAAGVLGMGALPLAPLIAGFGLALAGRTPTILVCTALCAVALVLAIANSPLRSLPVESGWAAHAKQFEIV
ncbi:major facilitator superfamily MFS_1 [Microbacterium esteraromaticum]|uniref:Major facilitator superfamily MFS_1 n=1 Tax=Microbacterium esteraromaticum TaxID=57043 RepID=A0A1R4K2E9_9MICO|nr:MFS transporter [Microbacterium esteraromaticum]SJN38429.1 major facilitator superfamily MFS_1 [Microbacterium esteraromaticum]